MLRKTHRFLLSGGRDWKNNEVQWTSVARLYARLISLLRLIYALVNDFMLLDMQTVSQETCQLIFCFVSVKYITISVIISTHVPE